MELRHLRYFDVIGREEHFGRASAILRIAQPALTRQIRDLEAELGVELFERLPRGVRLSAAGRVFLEDVGVILAQVNRSIERVKGLATGHLGTVRVGLSEIASAHHVIPQGLLDFRNREPNVELELRSMGSVNQIEALKDGRLDTAIVYDAHMAEQDVRLLDQVEIGSSEMMLAVYQGHPLADRESVSVSELSDEPILWPSRATAPGYHDRLMAACLAAGLSPRLVQECATHSIMLSLISVGMGIGFIASSTRLYQSSSVRLVPIDDLELAFRVLLLWRKGDSSPALHRFVSGMIQTVTPPEHLRS